MIVYQLIVYILSLMRVTPVQLWKEVSFSRTFVDILGATDTISKMVYSTLWIFFLIGLWLILPNPTYPCSKQALLNLCGALQSYMHILKITFWCEGLSLGSLVCQKLRQEVGSYKLCFKILSEVWKTWDQWLFTFSLSRLLELLQGRYLELFNNL